MRFLHTALIFFLYALSLSAQDVVLTVNSRNHPHRRIQWTQNQCEAWQQKYGAIRGINCPYPPCDAISQEQAIALAARMGYNSIRMWPGGGTNTQEYINSVEQWAAWAGKYGMTVAPVLTFGNTYYCMSDKKAALKQMEREVRAIIQHFRGDDRIILWDIWNEPPYDPANANVEPIMEWLRQMVRWCQEEGCTQPITCSIIWDAGVNNNQATATGVRKVREEVEKLMDLHNYHDYATNDGFGSETTTMVSRLNRLGKRPLVCTECMQRVSGSGYAFSLVDFSKNNINFYTWGLYSCSANWEIKWGKSAYYAWETMFHNALYADGEPFDEKEPPFVQNYAFKGDFGGIKTTPEYTEVWPARRAWRRQQGEPRKGLYAKSISEAMSLIEQHKDDGQYNQITVRLPYVTGTTDFTESNRTLFLNLLDAAEQANMKVMPVILTSENLSATTEQIALYAFNIMYKNHTDRRIDGWCAFEQTAAATATHKNKLQTIMRRVRYSFPNQPIFAVPMVENSTRPDTTGTDFANYLWQMSDISAYSAPSQQEETWENTLVQQYQRPVYAFCQDRVEQHRADRLNNAEGGRWPAWKAWRWMNRGPVKGVQSTSIKTALTKLNNFKAQGTSYNSICVPLEYRTYLNAPDTYMQEFDSLLSLAADLNMTVVPQLLSDSYISITPQSLRQYVNTVLTRYATDERILAWDLYNRPCYTSMLVAKATSLLDELFEEARKTPAQQPIFATASVTTKTLPSDFDVVQQLVHGVYNGWERLNFGKGNAALNYHVWCLSDIIAYSSTQDSRHLGYLNAQAGKFGRPMFCTGWKTVTTEPVSNVIDIFQDWHVSWFTSSTLSEQVVKDFHFIPIAQSR